MRNVIFKATATAIFAAFASVAIVMVVLPVLGGTPDRNAVLLAVLCPILLAWPVTAHTTAQKARLAETLGRLERAHQQLACTHADLAAAHARLAEKARLDEMTGILNRESFLAALAHARRRNEGGTLLIIDADNFKGVNDTYGHARGDEALRLIAHALSVSLRSSDMLGRIGGEEFAAFLPGTEMADAAVVAERIRRQVEKLHFHPLEGELLPLTVSIGGAMHRPQLSLSELMQEADQRLYQAKRDGRNRVVMAVGFSAAA